MNICHKLYIFVLYYEEKVLCDLVDLLQLLLGLQLPMLYSNLKEICFFCLDWSLNPENVLIMIYILYRYKYTYVYIVYLYLPSKSSH